MRERKKRLYSTSLASRDILLRWRRGERRHPGLEEPPPEPEGILAHEEGVDDLHDGELVEEEAGHDGDDEEGQLGHDLAQVGHGEDLGADHAADADGGNPGSGS